MTDKRTSKSIKRVRKPAKKQTAGMKRTDTLSPNSVLPQKPVGAIPKLAWLAVEDLYIDKKYQRKQHLQWAREAARNFKWSCMSSITVAKRTNKGEYDYYVTDGQQRVIAAILAGIKQVPCTIITDRVGVRAEAQDMNTMNSCRTNLSWVDKHRTRLAAKDKTARFIEDTIRMLGYRIVKKNEDDNNIYLACAQRLYVWATRCIRDKSTELFEEGMTIASAMHNGDRIDHRTITAVLQLETILTKKLSKHSVLSKRNRKRLTDPSYDGAVQLRKRIGAITENKLSSYDNPTVAAYALAQLLNEGRPASQKIPYSETQSGISIG